MEAENNRTGSSYEDAPNPRDSSCAEPTEKVERVPEVLAMAATINDSLLGLSPAVTVTGQYLGSGLASQMGFFTAANQYQQQAMVGMAATTADVCRLLYGSSSATGTPVESASGSHSSAGACEAAGQAAEAAVQDTGF